MKITLYPLLFCLNSISVFAQHSLPWTDFVFRGNDLNIESVSSAAKVSVSDGLTYTTQTLYESPQRVVLKMIYPDRLIVLGIDGKYVWQYNGKDETEGSEFEENFILGHQYHAFLLKFQSIFSSDYQQDELLENGLIFTRTHAIKNGWKHTLISNDNGKPVRYELETSDHSVIKVTFHNWKINNGLNLPFMLKIDDGERLFTYEYTKLEFNEGKISQFRTPYELLNDEQKLIRLHRKIMDGHFYEEQDFLKNLTADTVQRVSGGEVNISTGAEVNARMNRSMKSRKHDKYIDLIRPLVEISNDSTRGWITVQVYAHGETVPQDEIEKPQEFEFTSAWVALFKKVEKEWKMIGNVSNFKSHPR